MATMGFHDLRPGQTWRSTGRTLTETDLTLFAMLSGDRHPIHVDAEFAQATRYGQRLFHGTFGLTLTVAMATELPHLHEAVIAATGYTQWKFCQPLFIGDTVHVEAEIVRPEQFGS
ncbi:MaoC/PaaZ C-terminal domain-containing protein [Pigmentiphaga sp. GD03639]|uniref:MaoC/PaaZ C-terminal domain-containing protein n=1 Tax=Pigmentiphaga sp. GD03639 TaxID=2975354 RepID=UPI0024480D61|nr:MaoC/PaaZ C-terminal domain-containing protein [Pigmentiphaga sp. GD03639]MDH2240275.1 MaoC/PaaZ C-terminal domain-containing protein [Pigmentiphaga sp. GD03639]